MLLVSESAFRRLKQTHEGNVTPPSTILVEVKHPNEREREKVYKYRTHVTRSIEFGSGKSCRAQ